MIKKYRCYFCGREFETNPLHYKYLKCPGCERTIIEKEAAIDDTLIE